MYFSNATFKILFAVSCLASWFHASQAIAVIYEVTFDATWSAATHPSAYPSGAHFSPLIGTTHNDQVTFWEPGGIATAGIEQMAETGGTGTLTSEIVAAGSGAESLITTGGLNSPGSISTTFNISPSHPFVTLVTMIAPSPDWFVGIHDYDFRVGNAWLPQVTIDLFPYDAGTDSGVDFTSPNNDTNPQDPIALLGAPFTGTPAMGTFQFTLLGDFDLNGNIDGADFLKWHRGESPIPYSQADLDDWKINFGGATPAFAAAVVPEPVTWHMMLFGISLVLTSRRK